LKWTKDPLFIDFALELPMVAYIQNIGTGNLLELVTGNSATEIYITADSIIRIDDDTNEESLQIS
jgi:hypothetical protein